MYHSLKVLFKLRTVVCVCCMNHLTGHPACIPRKVDPVHTSLQRVQYDSPKLANYPRCKLRIHCHMLKTLRCSRIRNIYLYLNTFPQAYLNPEPFCCSKTQGIIENILENSALHNMAQLNNKQSQRNTSIWFLGTLGRRSSNRHRERS